MECDPEKLIFLIEKRPAIYNYKIKDHSNKIIIDKLWNDISKEMNCEVIVCRNKWTSLRNSYSRDVRSQKNIKSGSGGNQRKKWYLSDAMSFLKDFIQQHKSVGSNIDVENTEIASSEDFDEPSSSPPSSQSTTETAPGKRAKPLSVAEQVAGPMIQFLESRISQRSAQSEEDPNFSFLKSLLPDLNKLSPRKQRSFKRDAFLRLNDLTDLQDIENNSRATSNTTLSGTTASTPSYIPPYSMQYNYHTT